MGDIRADNKNIMVWKSATKKKTNKECLRNRWMYDVERDLKAKNDISWKIIAGDRTKGKSY